MNLITYNQPSDSDRRSKAKEMTFEEEKEAVELINKAVKYAADFDDREIGLIQQFVDNYQNLNHHKATTCGIYGTDHIPTINKIKEDRELEPKFWEITY